MKKIITIMLILAAIVLRAQTPVEQSIPVQRGQQVHLKAEWANLIKIQTWDKNEVMIKGQVSINKGENDDAFQIQMRKIDTGIEIDASLKNEEEIPRHITIKKGDKEYFFKSGDYKDPEVQRFLEENGHDYSHMSSGIVRDITLEVFVPSGIETYIDSKFGMVEVRNFNAPLSVHSKFGGIDAAVDAARVGNLTARTQFGEILSNLGLSFASNREAGDDRGWTVVSANPGNGPRYSFESKFGKVYLRKP